MRRIVLALLAVTALTLVAACGPVQLKGTAIEPPEAAPDFTLTDEQGQPFTLSAQQGKVVVLFFGFTSCPDICPAELDKVTSVVSGLGMCSHLPTPTQASCLLKATRKNIWADLPACLHFRRSGA